MKRFLIAMSFIAAYSFADCTYSDYENEKSCWEVTSEYPTYSNGKRYEAGEYVCVSGHSKIMVIDSTTIQGIPVKKMMYRKPCKKVIDVSGYKISRKDSVVESGYQTIYDRETKYIDDISISAPWYRVRQTTNVFFQDGVIELFRDNGSLRYKGKVIADEQVVTSGDCYNKSGSAPTRHTNNADNCK